AVAISVSIRRWLVEEDIYTIKLRHRGKHIPINRHTNMYLIQSAGELMTDVFKTLSADSTVKEAVKKLGSGAESASHIVMSDGERIVGYMRPNRMIHELEDDQETIRQFMRTDFVIARETDTMNDVISRMNRRNVKLALVVNNDTGIPRIDDVSGIIDVREIASAVVENHYS
ncbi:MAG TPA: CBS domain-containing protein, partial [Rhizobiales bacterium]|nr:CBS domain-containing protein [Hyphomicrobiales bacterium]